MLFYCKIFSLLPYSINDIDRIRSFMRTYVCLSACSLVPALTKNNGAELVKFSEYGVYFKAASYTILRVAQH